jgi:hypothetical protein
MLLGTNNEIKLLTNIKLCSEKKQLEINQKNITLVDINKKLENKVIELENKLIELENKLIEEENDINNKIKIRMKIFKDEFNKNIIDNEKYNKLYKMYNILETSMGIIKREIIGDKISSINLIKNNNKIIIKYFTGTEKNIDEFIKKFDSDLNNLFDSFNDDKINYKDEWIENIITNINNYTVNFNDYFSTNDNTLIKVICIKNENENKYIFKIFPEVDNLQLILNTIKNYKTSINELSNNKTSINELSNNKNLNK